MTEIDESPALFGPAGALLGILTRAPAASARPLACLMLNAGPIYRVGPHRINVKLARALAQRGVTSFRFDLAGMGDSQFTTEQTHYRNSAVQDVRAAMDHVQASTGIARFIVFGICSGAVNGYEAALADERVVGIALLDGFMFPSRWSRLHSQWHRLRSFPVNPAVADRTVRWLKRKFAARRQPPGIFEANTEAHTIERLSTGMSSLLARGVAIFLLYSGTLQLVDRGRSQLKAFGDAPFVKQVDYLFLPDVDHTVTSLAAQRVVIDAVGRWADLAT